jgi:hypothetical protein
LSGEPEAAKQIFSSASPEDPAAWAMNVLGCLSGSVADAAEARLVPALLALGADPARWPEAHAFSYRVRARLFQVLGCAVPGGGNHLAEAYGKLKDDPARHSERLAVVVLELCEGVARVFYNASNPPDPFCHSPGERVVSDAGVVASYAGDQGLSERLWGAVTGSSGRRAGA